jgi:hypothetical protein
MVVTLFEEVAKIADAAGRSYTSCPRCPEGMPARRLVWHLLYEHGWTGAELAKHFGVRE